MIGKHKKIWAIALAGLLAVGVGTSLGVSMTAEGAKAATATVASYSRSGTTDTVTGGTLSTNVGTALSSKSGYYQDDSTTATYGMQILSISTLFSSQPASITLSATLGGGSTKASGVGMYAILLGSDGSELGTAASLTDAITVKNGSSFSHNFDSANWNLVYGFKIYHTKLASYNVRYYAMSLSHTVADLSSIATTGTPDRTSYYDGESFDSTGLTVTATYSDASTADVTSSTVWTPNPLTAGTVSVTGTYTYLGVSKTVSISGLTVVTRSITSIEVTTSATKTNYCVTDTLDLTGLVVKAHWSVGDDTTITDDCTFDPASGYAFVAADIGVKTISISYSGKTTSYDVTISQLTIQRLHENKTALSGSSVYVEGTVTSIIDDASSTKNVYLQSGNYGVMAYKASSLDASIVVGAKVGVSGTVTIYKELIELASPAITYVGGGDTITPFEITAWSSEALADMDSRLVTIDIKYVSGSLASGTSAASVSCLLGETTVTMRPATATQAVAIYSTFDTFFDKTSTYGTFTFTGILGWYNGPQLSPSAIGEVSSDDVDAVDAVVDLLHMDLNVDGQCATYFAAAKAAVLALSADQLNMLKNATGYASAKARYEAWALNQGAKPYAAGDATALTASYDDSSMATVAIVIISVAAVTAIGAFFFLKRKKEA